MKIWLEEDGAAYVRSVNGGNETVPTVVIGNHPVTDPDPGACADPARCALVFRPPGG